MLSNRASEWISFKYPLMEGFTKVIANPFSPTSNPTGIINLGTAENSLMVDFLQEKIKDSSCLNISVSDLKYGEMIGNIRLRTAIAHFLTENLQLSSSLTAENITVHNGCGSVVEALSYVLGDPGDGVIIPGPYYGGFDMDIERRPQLKIIPAHSSKENSFVVTAADLERAWSLAKEQGVRVKAVLAMNPVNPQGTIYNKHKILELLSFCQKYDIHLIMDEIYAFSIIDPSVPFTSLYNLIQENDPRRDKVHIIWGFSKDFCMNGLRAGAFVSYNKDFLKAMNEQSYFTSIPSISQNLLSDLLEDDLWVKKFISHNQERLRKAYSHTIDFFDSFNQEIQEKCREKGLDKNNTRFVDYIPVQGAFFVWMDLSFFLKNGKTEQEERKLWLRLIDEAGVYIAPGLAFHCEESGWFRMVFAEDHAILTESFTRIRKFLIRYLDEQCI